MQQIDLPRGKRSIEPTDRLKQDRHALTATHKTRPRDVRLGDDLGKAGYPVCRFKASVWT